MTNKLREGERDNKSVFVFGFGFVFAILLARPIQLRIVTLILIQTQFSRYSVFEQSMDSYVSPYLIEKKFVVIFFLFIFQHAQTMQSNVCMCVYMYRVIGIE